MIVAMVAILNFYKSIMKREKETKFFMEQEKRRQAEEKLIEQEKSEFELRLRMNNNKQQQIWQEKWLEYDDKCLDLHALIFRPNDYNSWTRAYSSENNVKNVTQRTIEKNELLPVVACGSDTEGQCDITTTTTSVPKKQMTGNAKGKGKIMERISESSSSIIYVVVLILLISLGKAVFDLRKQFKEVLTFTYTRLENIFNIITFSCCDFLA